MMAVTMAEALALFPTLASGLTSSECSLIVPVRDLFLTIRPWLPWPRILSSSPASAAVAPERRRGRAATGNPSGRFETRQRVDLDDGWGALEELPPFRTEIIHEKPRTLITRNDSPDIAFDRSINPYRGCEHGCIYCFARPTHAYLGLSPGLDFESRLFVKDERGRGFCAANCRRRATSRKSIAIGTNTDPYQPIEREHRRHARDPGSAGRRPTIPVAIVTKSALVLRDLDMLGADGGKGPGQGRAFGDDARPRTGAGDGAARRRRRSAGWRRSRSCRAAGVPAAVMVAPVIPGVTDHEIEAILDPRPWPWARARPAISCCVCRWRRRICSPIGCSNIIPDKYRKVMALLRSTREGKIYDSAWGKRMTGTGPYAWMIGRRFEMACDKIGFNTQKIRLRTDLFVRPQGGGVQLSLF